MSVVTKAKDNKPEPIAYSEAALRNNAVVVEYCRTSMAALSGSTAGNYLIYSHDPTSRLHCSHWWDSDLG